MSEPVVGAKLTEIGNKMFELFHLFGLFVIGAAILWASWVEVFEIIAHGGPKIKDVLLLFIYLELGAMVGIYFQTKHLPVRYLLYIAVTALTRVLAIDIKSMSDIHMLTLTGAILILALAVLVLRIGSTRFNEKDSIER
ncbi:MAG: phosphate-starvation-inducible PsiE family protein [Gammaproteobacteria bacterium]|nr:phosphate-starvation-inducible PsiE family protein [Gammaproteobacteria bacterium]MCP5438824.1 phosphate-starvation-inducible PsiE family protein [Chromatiaceae bacterium]MCP5439625.1 phosphate-starvation-inducible PsiE family protein [Chromatiaceae bacterium]HPE79155.1 phosphate-starvation-inducible PsiE family protein [Gammaproteobacteria bacterium]